MKLSKKQILNQIPGTAGIVGQLLIKVNKILEEKQIKPIARNSLVERLNKDADLKKAWEEESERKDDIWETKLIEAANKGEKWAIALMVKYKGRKKGYIQSHNFTDGEGNDLPPVIPVMADPELMGLIKERNKRVAEKERSSKNIGKSVKDKVANDH